MLLTLCQQVQTAHVFKVSDMVVSGDLIVFRLSETLKHHRWGSLGLLSFSSYHLYPALDVVRCIKEDVVQTEIWGGADSLFIITTQPTYRWASNATLAHWTRTTLKEADVQVWVWSGHSLVNRPGRGITPFSSGPDRCNWQLNTPEDPVNNRYP